MLAELSKMEPANVRAWGMLVRDLFRQQAPGGLQSHRRWLVSVFAAENPNMACNVC